MQRQLLVSSVHGRAGIDQVSKRRVVVAINGIMFNQNFDNRRHRKEVADVVCLHQLPKQFGVQARARHQHGGRATRHVEQHVHARAMRERRHGNGAVVLGGARDQIGQVVGHHKGHLPVRQHRSLGLASGARGVEEPQGVVVGDGGFGDTRASVIAVRRHQRFVAPFTGHCRADLDDLAQAGRGFTHRLNMARKNIFHQQHHRTAGLRQVSDFGRREPKVGGHPDSAQTKRHPTTLEHLHVVARQHQQPVARRHAQTTQRQHHGVNTLVDLAPCPHLVTMNQRHTVRKLPSRLAQQLAQIHDLSGVHGGVLMGS